MGGIKSGVPELESSFILDGMGPSVFIAVVSVTDGLIISELVGSGVTRCSVGLTIGTTPAVRIE